MRTIHVLRSGPNYFIDGIYWGDDEEGVILYLKAKVYRSTVFWTPSDL